MTPEKKAAVLADFRAKKATSAAQLAKMHGLSRSAVYRLLKNEQKDEPESKEESESKTRDDVSVTSFTSQDNAKFLRNSDIFAEDLGLPLVSDIMQHDENPNSAAAKKERNLDDAVSSVFGSGGTAIVDTDVSPEVLSKVFEERPPRRTRQRVEPEQEREPEREPEPVRVDRQDLIQRIVFNVENFGPLLSTIVGTDTQAFIKSLHTLGPAELQRTLEVLERTRSVGNIAAGFKTTFFMVAQATEVVTLAVGVKAKGFAERIRAEDAQVTMIMKELALENWNRVKAMDSPTARLGVLFCMTLAQTDSMNRLNEVMRPQMASPVPDAFSAAHKDL